MRKSLFQRLTMACLALLIGVSLAAQPKVTLSGQVVDDFGEPLMGVGVIQQGTTNGVATDLDGMYSITVPAGAVVEFSLICLVKIKRQIICLFFLLTYVLLQTFSFCVNFSLRRSHAS